LAGRKNETKGFLVVTAVIALLALYLLMGNIFIVREITVEGNQSFSDADVIRMSGLSIGGSIFRVNTEETLRNLSLSGTVKPIDVAREYPSTIKLTVKEREPSIYVDCYGMILIVDDEGVMMQHVSTLPGEQYIYVTGLKPTYYNIGRTLETDVKGQVEAMAAVVQAVKTANLVSQISELNVADPDNMYLIARSGMQILLGDAQKLPDKITIAVAAMNDLSARGIVGGRLDVRTGRFADFLEEQ